jgi:3-oxoadipate enol-lactonase/4-carboxymuconolactone decarboxylase
MPAISRAGQRVAYDDLGAGPPTVLLAHNLFSHRGSFAEVAARLARRARVLNVDLRGHGDSRDAGEFTVADLAGDLAAVLAEAGADAAVIVGTSLGAAAAIELARARPALVRGLVLMAANPRPATFRDRLTFGTLAAIVRALGPGPLLPTLVAALHSTAAAPAIRAAAAEQIRAMNRRDVARAVRAWVNRPALLGRLGPLSIPTRVVAGGADSSCPRAACDALAAELGVASIEIASAGHTIQAERPAEVAALVEGLLAGP